MILLLNKGRNLFVTEKPSKKSVFLVSVSGHT